MRRHPRGSNPDDTYYLVVTEKGRFPCPPQYLGTVIEKDFRSGRFGGRVIDKTRRFEDTKEDRRNLVQLLRRTFDAQIYRVENARSPRLSLHRSRIMTPAFIEFGMDAMGRIRRKSKE